MSWISDDTKIYLKGMWKDLWYYSSLSFSIALSIILGTGIGYLLDNHYTTTPTWTLIGMFLGVCAGFRNIYLAMKKAQRMGRDG
jgi:ATP synthase protein I